MPTCADLSWSASRKACCLYPKSLRRKRPIWQERPFSGSNYSTPAKQHKNSCGYYSHQQSSVWRKTLSHPHLKQCQRRPSGKLGISSLPDGNRPPPVPYHSVSGDHARSQNSHLCPAETKCPFLSCWSRINRDPVESKYFYNLLSVTIVSVKASGEQQGKSLQLPGRLVSAET